MSSGVLWSDDEDQRLRNLAQSGLAIRQIALRMNRSHAVIRRHAAKLKIGIAGGWLERFWGIIFLAVGLVWLYALAIFTIRYFQ